jgi:hypothetical protein
LPFEYERKIKIKGKDTWQKVRVFGSLEEMRKDWLTRDEIASDDPFRKAMIESIDMAIAGKIKPGDIFNKALSKYEILYGKQDVKLSRLKDE